MCINKLELKLITRINLSEYDLLSALRRRIRIILKIKKERCEVFSMKRTERQL